MLAKSATCVGPSCPHTQDLIVHERFSRFRELLRLTACIKIEMYCVHELLPALCDTLMSTVDQMAEAKER